MSRTTAQDGDARPVYPHPRPVRPRPNEGG